MFKRILVLLAIGLIIVTTSVNCTQKQSVPQPITQTPQASPSTSERQPELISPLSDEPSPTLTPTPPTQSLENSGQFDVKQYTGILSSDCKEPVTNLTGQSASSFKITVDAAQTKDSLNHNLWTNFRPSGLFSTTVAEDNQPFWELMRHTSALRCIRVDDYFTDGFSTFVIADLKKFLQDGKVPLDTWGKRSAAFNYWGCRVYSEDEQGNPQYNFWFLDQVLDTLVAASLKPEFEVDYMPDALAGGEKARNFGGGLANIPKDYDKWRELIYQTVKHCIERYGIEEVRTWYWSIWNEPDNETYFMGGTVRAGAAKPESVSVDNIPLLLMMYDYFVDGVKKADAHLKVGGPAIPYFIWLEPFLTHCVEGKNYATGKTGTPIDFISWHVFGNITELLSGNKSHIDVLKQFPQLAGRLTFVDEWGQALALWDAKQQKLVNNRSAPEIFSNYEAAFICKFIDGVLAKPENAINRFFRNGNPSQTTSGYRCLSFTGGTYFRPLPVLNAYIMLAKMGDQQIEFTGSSFGDKVHGFASRTADGVQVLLYNHDEADRECKGKAEEIDLTIKNLQPTWSKMKRYQVDSKNSNTWANLQIFERITSLNQLAQAQENSKLKIIEQTDRLEIKNGTVTFHLTVPANSVCLVVIGDEALPPSLNMTPHINQVLMEEAAYRTAQAKLDKGDIAGAETSFKQLASDSFAAVTDKSSKNPYCFWGQKALFALYEIHLNQKNYSAAENVRVQLLSTTLGDIDRYILLNDRLLYIDSTGNKVESEKVKRELEEVRARLEYFTNWTKWTPALYAEALIIGESQTTQSYAKPAQYEYSATIKCDQTEWTYLIHIPQLYDGTRPVPLVLALHPAGRNSTQMAQLTGFNTIAERENFIIVYPKSCNVYWNTETEAVHLLEDVDEIDFIASLIDNLSQQFNIDSKKIFVTGVSSGGSMSFVLAGQLSEKIAAIATVGSTIFEDMLPELNPEAPLSVLHIHGTKDPTCLWQGGNSSNVSAFAGGAEVRFFSVPEIIKFWVNYNHCVSTPNITQMPDNNPNDGTRVNIEQYIGGTNGTEVILYRVEEGGHTWPDSKNPQYEVVNGKICHDFDASEVIWQFFKDHPKK